jgi:hypothetical protein
MTIVELEHRVAELEKKVGHLARKVDGPNSKTINAWIDEIHGTFQNDATYRKAASFGRQWRKSQRPGSARARKVASK